MATTPTATASQALLALYGALDRAVTSNQGGATEEIVERYLPGSTGAHAGWYDELLGFLYHPPHLAPRNTKKAPVTPGLSDALAALADHPRPWDSDATSDTLSIVQLARMVYAIGALSQLPAYQIHNEQFARTLMVIGPETSVEADAGSTSGDKLLSLLQSSFGERGDWPPVMKYALSQGLIDPKVAGVPLCEVEAKWVRGQLCAVLTTEFDSKDVSLEQLLGVVDPRNWAKCLSFFCKMEPKKRREDGWERVLEHVSTTCSISGTPQMVTPLKYWKGPPADKSQLNAYLEYALDELPESNEKGDGRVVVDEGFISMTSTVTDPNDAGVRVRTRKVVGFRDLPWIAGAIFACAMGYGSEGMDMLLGGVERKAKNADGWTAWTPSIAPSGTPPSPGEPGQPGDPPDASRRAVAIAVDMLNECIDDMSAKSAAIAAKWAKGGIPIEETVSYGSDMAVRLATDPWRYLQRLADPTQGNKK